MDAVGKDQIRESFRRNLNLLSDVLNSISDDFDTKADKSELASYVAKETGKGLSTNDFTNTDKAKLNAVTTDTATTSANGLMSAVDKIKLNGVANNAQVNVIEIVEVNNSVLPVSNKAVNIDLSNYVTKDGSKVLSTNDYTTTEKNKLSSIAANAQVNVIESVKVNGTALTPSSKAVNIDLSNYVAKDGSKVLSTNDFTTAEKTKLANVAENANNYVLPTASSSTLGGVKIGSNISVDSGTISISKDNVTNALGYTPPSTNTTYSIGTTAAAGLTKLYTSTGTATDGTMTQNAIKSALDSKLNSNGKATSATSADKLSNACSLKVSLSSTSAPTFDGSANVTTIGVGGILPTAYGGTGNSNGTVNGAAQLNTSRNFVTNLASTVAGSFNGTASVSAGVTGTLPVTNGGTGVSDLNNVTVGAASRDNAGNVISDTYVTKAELIEKTRSIYKVYGYRIKKEEADPYARVEYLYDAVGMIPAHMDFTNGVFDYGSWKDVWFVRDNKPCMLKSDGTVDYYLDPDDYTKKEDGTVSDVANTNYDGNAMAQIPLCWVYRYEDDNYLYEIVSPVQLDENYKAYAHTDANGIIKPYFYWALFGASGNATKMRSLKGQTLALRFTAANYISGAVANGSGWYINSWSQHCLIATLLVLIGKSTDTQTVFGVGNLRAATSDSTLLKTGTLADRGQFFGFNTNNKQVKCFHIEGLWGDQSLRTAGIIAYNGEYYVKMTPEGSGYRTSDVIGYTDTGLQIASGAWVKSMSCSEYGLIPIDASGSDSTYFCDDYLAVSNNCGYLMTGCSVWQRSTSGGIFGIHLHKDASANANDWNYGVAIAYV